MSKLPRSVRLFGLVSLFNDFASEMVYPLLPAFLTTALGAGPAALGALDGAADLASSVAKLGSGRLADKPRARGPLVVLGYAVAGVVRPVIAVAGTAWHVIALRATDRIGKGIRTPPRDAMIATATPPELQGRAFGFQRSLDHVGAVLGPLAAWWLLASGRLDVRGVIAASAVPAVLVLVLAIVAVRTVGGGRGRTETDGVPAPPRPSATDPVRLRPPLFAIAAFYFLRIPETLLILHAQRLGVSVAAVTLLWAALHVVRSASSFAGGVMSDRVGEGRTLRLGWLAYAALVLAFAASDGPVQAWLVFLALGVVAGLTEAPERALVSRLAGKRVGSGFGNYHALAGVAALAGGVLLGVAFEQWGAELALGLSSAAALALAGLAPYALRTVDTPA